jgi:acetylornithine/LysW-gamma-L-lysine aminotransferase
MTIQELESQFTSGVYTKRPIALVRGKGARVWDSDENEYVDCVGGQGSVNIGHANPAVAEAIAKQAQTLITCPEMFYNDRRAELEQKLTSIAGMPRVFLCNSGTEAVEAAIKFAASSRRCAVFTGAPSGRCRPRGRRNTANRSSHWCRISVTSHTTMLLR